VLIALALLALTAGILLEQRVGVVQDAARVKEVRILWTLAAQKMADLELDKTMWLGQGQDSQGDFGDISPAYASYTWAYHAAREPVETFDPTDPANQSQKPKEIFRLSLAVVSPGLPEPFVVEALLPVQEPKTPQPGDGSAPGAPGPAGTPGNAGSPPAPPGPAPAGTSGSKP
jgi:hypothetical protein